MPLFRRANALISQASGTLSRSEAMFTAIAEDLREAIEEFQDGFSLELGNTGEGSIMDFVTGKISTLPIYIRVKPRESLDKK